MWQVWVSSSMLIFRHVVICCWRREDTGIPQIWESYGVVTINVPRNMLTWVDVWPIWFWWMRQPCFATSLHQTRWEGRFDCIWRGIEVPWYSRSCWCGDCRRAWIFLHMIHGECCGRSLYQSLYPFVFVGSSYPGEWLKFTLRSKIRLGNFWF